MDRETVAPPGLRDWPGFQLYKAGWWLQQELERAVRPLGINSRHFMILTMLQASSELSQQQMATYMSLDPTIMVSLIDDLEGKELCERVRDPADRRRNVVRITAKGRRLFAKARAVSDRIEDEVLAPLSDAARARLARDIAAVMEEYWARKQVPPRRRGSP